MVKWFIKNIAQRILKPEVLKEPNEIISLLEDQENYLPLNEIYIRVFAKSLLEIMLDEGEISDRDEDKLFCAALAF